MAYVFDTFTSVPLLTPFTHIADFSKRHGDVWAKIGKDTAVRLLAAPDATGQDIKIVAPDELCYLLRVGPGGDTPYVPMRVTVEGRA